MQRAVLARLIPITQSRWAKTIVTSYGVTALLLGCNVATGMITARALGASGRGELTAVISSPLMLYWLCTFGLWGATAYHQTQKPTETGELIGTMLPIAAVIGVISVLLSELLLSILLGAQSDTTVRIAHVFVLSLFFAPFSDLFNSILSADQEFGWLNLLRVAQPAIQLVLYVVLWQLDDLSVGSALMVVVISGVPSLVLAGTKVIRRYGVGSFSASILKPSFMYGLRMYATSFGSLVVARFDMAVIPAVLSAAAIGHYSAATSVATIALALPTSLTYMVFPIAARRGREAPPVVFKFAAATALGGIAFGLMVGFAAPPLVHILYGPQFEESVLPLRILLPGAICLGTAAVFVAAIQALGRPLSSSLGHFVGMIAAVGGVAFVLYSDFGIVGLAIVSTISYALVLVVSCCVYLRLVKPAGWLAFRS